MAAFGVYIKKEVFYLNGWNQHAICGWHDLALEKHEILSKTMWTVKSRIVSKSPIQSHRAHGLNSRLQKGQVIYPQIFKFVISNILWDAIVKASS